MQGGTLILSMQLAYKRHKIKENVKGRNYEKFND